MWDQFRDIADQFKALRNIFLIWHEQVLFAQFAAIRCVQCQPLGRSPNVPLASFMREFRRRRRADAYTRVCREIIGVRRPSVSLVANTLQYLGY